MSRYIRGLYLAFSVLLFMSCQKETETVVAASDSSYSGRIKFVLQFNPSQFSTFYGFLQTAGLADTLASPGPFTVFAPGNNYLSIYTPVDPGSYILPGYFPLSQIPAGQTRILTAPNGYKLFLSSYDNGGNTAYTVNGALIQAVDQHAANGVIETMNGMMNPIYYRSPLDYIEGNPVLSEFAYAVKRAHLDTLLSDTTVAYSVLAFNGFPGGLDSISRMDPDSLAQNVVKYHIIPGRLFLYDYIRQYQGDGVTPDTIAVPTLNGNPVYVVVSPAALTNPFNNPVVFFGKGNSSYNPISVVASHLFYVPDDIPAGLGTVQEIPGILVP